MCTCMCKCLRMRGACGGGGWGVEEVAAGTCTYRHMGTCRCTWYQSQPGTLSCPLDCRLPAQRVGRGRVGWVRVGRGGVGMYGTVARATRRAKAALGEELCSFQVLMQVTNAPTGVSG